MNNVYNDIQKEREYQKTLGWDDSKNTATMFATYICNYATRFTMPFTFKNKKYSFRTCMLKVAALAVAAIEWYDSKYSHDEMTDAELCADAVSKNALD